MDPIKEAFSKIKEEINSLKEEISTLRIQLNQISVAKNFQQTTPTHNLTQETLPTNQPTNQQISLEDISPPEGLLAQNTQVSTGNRGVPTDRQTDQQTNQPTLRSLESSHNLLESSPPISRTFPQKDPVSDFKRANEILSTLDDIKKEIRIKFKDLTPQEMLVFSTLYALEEQNTSQITYKLIAGNLNLSESSIRDYFNKLIKKGVPIEKIRQNNKTITLKISSDLKNITTLATIQRLREL